jgi:hypothetical protein
MGPGRPKLGPIMGSERPKHGPIMGSVRPMPGAIMEAGYVYIYIYTDIYL